MNYFNKLPIISHSNNLVRNIMSRVSLAANSSFYEYQTKDDTSKAYIISKKYYDSYAYEWLVNLSNQVVDPYYDLGLDSQNFDDFITEKYGSQANAQSTILYYKNDWESDDSIISTATYQAYSESEKKYWQPVYNYLNAITGYQRKQEDWIVNTNRLVSIVVSSHSYSDGDRVTQANSSASGMVYSSNSTNIILKNINGAFDTSVLSGNVVPTSVSILEQNIASVEDHYWTSVDAFTYELELNESKKNIVLLDNRLKDRVEEEIKNLF